MFLNCGYPAYHKDGKIHYVHIDVAEAKLGRKLGKHEIVHHKDGNKENSSPDNIIVLRSNKQHMILHHIRHGVETFMSRDGSTVVVKNQIPCAHCKGLYEPSILFPKYCTTQCAAASRFNHIVDPKALAKQVWDMPSTKVAMLYGVSDRCIKKWCDKFGIEKPPRGYWVKKEMGLI